MRHGTLNRGYLIKKGKQVQKFWKFDGYGIAVNDLRRCKGVILHTQYDGVLYAYVDDFAKHGIPHLYKDEQQLVLPTNYWRQKGQ